MTHLDYILVQNPFQPESSDVWKEIVSRWGQADYDDETKRKAHQETLKKADDLGVEIPSPRGYIDLFELTGRMSGDKDKKDK